MDDLERHRQAVDRALSEAGLGWDAWPQAAADPTLEPSVRLSALLLMLSLTAPRIEIGSDYRELLDPTADVIDRLRRNKLPWDAATATTALRAVTALDRFDDRRMTVALRGAEQVCSSGRADTALLDALRELSETLEHHPEHVWRVPETREHARRVLVAASPPDLLDLTLVREHGDSWGGPAREAARQAPADSVARLVRLLGDLGGKKPSRAWLAAVGSVLTDQPAPGLLRRWLELAADADVVPPRPDTTVAASGGMLFCRGNDDLVRAAVLASRLLDDAWVPGVLGVLALRGAAPCGAPGIPEAMALKVASAAVDTLAVRGTPADREVLEQLLEDLQRRDLVRRVGAALGRGEEAARREEQLRQVKAAAVRRKADPAPRQARSAVDALLREHVTPVLRKAGFTGSGRTLRRWHDDRVDLVSLGSSEDRLSVTYGAWFDGAHPQDEPHPVSRDRVGSPHLDVRLSEHLTATPDELARFADRLREVVLPFLDTLGRYELVVAFAEHGAGSPDGALRLESADSPATSGFVGLLALSVGDRQRAVRHLEARAVFEETEAYDTDQEAVGFWRRHLERARQAG